MGVRKNQPDFWLFLTIFILLAIGTMMIFSSSAASAYTNNNNTYLFLQKQLVWVAFGLLAMFVTSMVDYRLLGKYSFILFIIGIFFLAIIFIPGIGKIANGAKRWIGVGNLTFQPSELVKITTILFFSYSLSLQKQKEAIKKFSGFILYIGMLGVIVGLLLLEPHFSCTIIISLVCIILLFLGGAKLWHFAVIALPALVGVIVLFFVQDYMMGRWKAFIDPFSDVKGNGWQIVQSLYAIGSGGLFGKGLGRSVQKYLYLPEPYNDFILSILAEELGFIGVAVVLTLFVIFIWRGFKISFNAPDKFGSLLAAGITSLIAVQLIINVAVVTASIPVTGMPLPFFSYGGTSLVFLLTDMGILLNISKNSHYEKF